MPTRKDDGRRLIQITMSPQLYERVRTHCTEIEMPITVWTRSIIQAALERSSHTISPPP